MVMPVKLSKIDHGAYLRIMLTKANRKLRLLQNSLEPDNGKG